MAQLVHAIAPDAELYFATPNPVDKDDHPTSPSMAIDQANEWAESYVNVIKQSMKSKSISLSTTYTIPLFHGSRTELSLRLLTGLLKEKTETKR